METLKYEIDIAAPAKKVWDTMLNKETYEQWVAKSWPNSSYEGRWQKGERIRFVGPDGAGTLAELDEIKPHEEVLARHVAVLLRGGEEDRTGDMAQTWIGTTEGYRFVERDGTTTVMVTIKTPAAWRKMFDDGWPQALDELKKIAEGRAN